MYCQKISNGVISDPKFLLHISFILGLYLWVQGSFGHFLKIYPFQQIKAVGLLVNYTFIFSHSSTGVVTGRIKNKD